MLAPKGSGLQRFAVEPDRHGHATVWLPGGADAFVLPFSSGLEIATSDVRAMRWLAKGSPWQLLELPLFGVRYGARTLAVIVPWPHYAQLVFGERVGVRFSMPAQRHDAAPCVVLAEWGGRDPLAIARVWRAWRAKGRDLGLIPSPRPLADKVRARPNVGRLFGAAHFYLWGNARFSHHDVPRNRWIGMARALRKAHADTTRGALVRTFSPEARKALEKLADAEWPELWLTRTVATAIDAALSQRTWSSLDADLSERDVLDKNRRVLQDALGAFVNADDRWGDGVSLSMLSSIRAAGVDRALLLTSDLYRDSVRADVARRADELGYIFGPYDSYHSVHAPDAHADSTWVTAQFDRAAFENGRVIRQDGTGHAGFKKRGYHFAPAAAWPYVRARVGGHVCACALHDLVRRLRRDWRVLRGLPSGTTGNARR